MLFNILSVITLLLCFLMGFYVYVNNKNNKINQSFIFIIFGAMLWIFTNLMTDISDNLDYISLWSKAAMIGPIFFGYFFYRLSRYFPREKNYKQSPIHENVLLTLTIIIWF